MSEMWCTKATVCRLAPGCMGGTHAEDILVYIASEPVVFAFLAAVCLAQSKVFHKTLNTTMRIKYAYTQHVSNIEELFACKILLMN